MATVAPTTNEPLPLENSYAGLPDAFFARVDPTPVPKPQLLRLNRPLAQRLGLDAEALTSAASVAALAGNRVPEGATPIAMAYAGHQFGGFVPSLGDGRAVLLGEVVDRDGIRRDIHLKGAGRTPFSRMGDGRAGIGPVLREYVISEAMAGLRIPTTRALAMLATGERIYRQSVEPGAVLARVAASHVRIGTFEYFYHRGDKDSLGRLSDYVIDRHYPQCREASQPYRALLDEVIARQADLVAQWMGVGFIHGVMNTDNVSIAGETIDYGPCAFMDSYHPDTVYSAIDRTGRYAYNQQPRIAFWNLAQFAQCLLPLLDKDEDAAIESARAALDTYAERFETTYHAGLRAKIGLGEAGEGDIDLALDLLKRMAEQQADFTNTFRRLADCAADDPATDRGVRALFADPQAFDGWAEQWRQRLARESRSDAERRDAMHSANPAYIPRNHRVQQVIDAVVHDGDLQPLEKLLTVVSKPFEEHPELSEYANPPQPEEVIQQTFCGT